MNPLNVTVADGTKVQVSYIVRTFKWHSQNTPFQSDLMSLPLGCCNMMLGIEWLVTRGDITWNFDKLTMDFSLNCKR